MGPSELAETALSMKNATFKADDLWTTFEVIENGELGMQEFFLLSSLHVIILSHGHKLSPPLTVLIRRHYLEGCTAWT